MVGAESAQYVPFFGVASRGQTFTAIAQSHLHGGQSGATPGRMNQHTLACRHFGDMPERVGGGNECNWNCYGIDAAQVARVTRKQARGAANMRTQGGSNQSEDSVSDAKVGHALADRHDTPGGRRTEHE